MIAYVVVISIYDGAIIHSLDFIGLLIPYGQESESAEILFLWGPKHEQFSNASLSALNLKKHFEN